MVGASAMRLPFPGRRMSQYDVIMLAAEPAVEPEQMGSKEKYWLDYDHERWLFKIPRQNTGEHWSEKVAYEIATLLGIPAALVELAERTDGTRGTICRSFVGDGESLIHGNELMHAFDESYDKGKKRGQSDHRIDLVLRCVIAEAKNSPAGTLTGPRTCFVGYIVLDALIGNTDRHHENWGVVRSATPSGKLAPSYDHASSLGRELLDTKRSELLQRGSVTTYLARGQSAIFNQQGEACPPYSLVGEMCRLGFEQEVEHWRDAARRVGLDKLRLTLERVPRDWISGAAIEFAASMLEIGYDRLVSGTE